MLILCEAHTIFWSDCVVAAFFVLDVSSFIANRNAHIRGSNLRRKVLSQSEKKTKILNLPKHKIFLAQKYYYHVDNLESPRHEQSHPWSGFRMCFYKTYSIWEKNICHGEMGIELNVWVTSSSWTKKKKEGDENRVMRRNVFAIRRINVSTYVPVQQQ